MLLFPGFIEMLLLFFDHTEQRKLFSSLSKNFLERWWLEPLCAFDIFQNADTRKQSHRYYLQSVDRLKHLFRRDWYLNVPSLQFKMESISIDDAVVARLFKAYGRSAVNRVSFMDYNFRRFFKTEKAIKLDVVAKIRSGFNLKAFSDMTIYSQHCPWTHTIIYLKEFTNKRIRFVIHLPYCSLQ
jgi:hypothetical protein